MANGILGATGGWFGYDGLTFERLVGWALAPLAWLLGIAIQIGTLASLQPERRGQVARLGLLALLAGSLASLANAAIAGVVAAT